MDLGHSQVRWREEGLGLGIGEESRSEPLSRRKQAQGHTQQYAGSLKVKGDQQGPDEMKYGPRSWGAVMAAPELQFPLCALKPLNFSVYPEASCSHCLGVGGRKALRWRLIVSTLLEEPWVS